jgi:hypothetical protein
MRVCMHVCTYVYTYAHRVFHMANDGMLARGQETRAEFTECEVFGNVGNGIEVLFDCLLSVKYWANGQKHSTQVQHNLLFS